jgi:hypothetical protein
MQGHSGNPISAHHGKVWQDKRRSTIGNAFSSLDLSSLADHWLDEMILRSVAQRSSRDILQTCLFFVVSAYHRGHWRATTHSIAQQSLVILPTTVLDLPKATGLSSST